MEISILLGSGVIAAIITAGMSLYISKQSQYKAIVTAERTKWLNLLRENICELLEEAYALMDDGVYSGDSSECMRKRTQMQRHVNMIVISHLIVYRYMNRELGLLAAVCRCKPNYYKGQIPFSVLT